MMKNILPNSSFFSQEDQLALEKIWNVNQQLKQAFIERDEIIDSLFIALLSNEHLLLIGPPGTAKSYLNKSFASCIQGYTYFYWQMTKYTTPEELFGPYSVPALKEGRYERIPTNMFQEADIVDLDEVFEGNSAILNAQNSAMNERTFERKPIPLKMMIGATNNLPKNGTNAAFLDRFMMRHFVDPIHENEANFIELLELQTFEINLEDQITQEEIELLQVKIDGVKIDQIEDQLVKLWQFLRSENVEPSDRRWKKSVRILKAKALLEGNAEVQEDDLQLLKHLLWNERKEIRIVESTIMKSISPLAAKLQEFVNSAEQIQEDIKHLDMKNSDDSLKITEGLNKLREIQKEVQKIAEKKSIKESVKEAASAKLIQISNILQNTMVDKLGLNLK